MVQELVLKGSVANSDAKSGLGNNRSVIKFTP